MFFFAHGSITKGDEGECYSHVVFKGIVHVKCQDCRVSLNLHSLGFVESVFLTWSLQEVGAQEASPCSTMSV